VVAIDGGHESSEEDQAKRDPRALGEGHVLYSYDANTLITRLIKCLKRGTKAKLRKREISEMIECRRS
jgi:hypothetical protein